MELTNVINLFIILLLLVVLELIYFKTAKKLNIVDKPNDRSSHTSITLRGGGIIFLFGTWLYAVFYGFPYPWFLAGLTLVSLISFVDDIKSLPDSVRLVVQFTASSLVFFQLDILHWNMWWIVILALIVYVGITNVYNFMDGVNGMTGGYSFVVLLSFYLLNRNSAFVDDSLLLVSILSVIVFCIFNFRPKGKAKCFAGDVGSISMAFIILFILGRIIFLTGDITYLILLVVYGIDACLTIVHRILLHENIGEAHRKHVYQLMANELKIGHVTVSMVYMLIQLIVSLGFIYLCPNTIAAHWIYLILSVVVLAFVYVIFKKKYYHLHEEYLKALNSNTK